MLLEVTTKAARTNEGSETAARLLEVVVGVAEGSSITLVQQGQHLHALQPGTLVLAPVQSSPAGRWIYLASRTRRAMVVNPGERRATVAFVRRWRAAAQTDLATRVDDLIALTAHPSAVARQIAFETISRSAVRFRDHMTPSRVETLARPLEQPEVPVERRLAVVRLLALVAGQSAADHLAPRLLAVGPQRVRQAVAGLLGRFPTTNGRRALEHCLVHARGALAERCKRLVVRLRAGGAP